MANRFVSILAAAVVVAVSTLVLSGTAAAQVIPPGSPPADQCAVVPVALERLTGVPTTTFSAPALATPQAGGPTGFADAVATGRGYEISAGTISADTRFGATFVGDVAGGLPGALFSSVHYAPPSPGPAVTNYVVGGEWALCGSWGVVFGSFTDGAIRWNADGSLAAVDTDVAVLGGSINGVALSGGSGGFGGALDHTPLAQGLPPTIGGTLQLQVSAAPAAGGALPDTGGIPVGSALLVVGVGLLAVGTALWRSS
jgi:hypothetical protein